MENEVRCAGDVQTKHHLEDFFFFPSNAGSPGVFPLYKSQILDPLEQTLHSFPLFKCEREEKEVLQMVFGLDVSCTSYFILQQTNGKDASGKSKGKGKGK